MSQQPRSHQPRSTSTGKSGSGQPAQRRGKQLAAPRPGLVLDVDRSTPPVLLHSGEQFRLERLPAGRSRIIYPPEPLPGLEHPDEAIRDALLNPVDSDPLPAQLFAGMKLTIAFDDISLPLPKMRRPDIRQRVIEAVLDLAADAGVDDIHIIAALALHRRMTESELRYCLGDRIYDAFAPRGQLYMLKTLTAWSCWVRLATAKRCRCPSGQLSPI